MAGREGSQKTMYEQQMCLLRAGVQVANVEIVFHPKLAGLWQREWGVSWLSNVKVKWSNSSHDCREGDQQTWEWQCFEHGITNAYRPCILTWKFLFVSVSIIFYVFHLYKLNHGCHIYTGNLASLEMKSISIKGIGYKITLLKKRLFIGGELSLRVSPFLIVL